MGPVTGWSGNSLKSMGLSWYVVGINTSGLLYRYACGTSCSKCTPSQAYGAWITAGGGSMLGYGTSLYNNIGFYANGNTLQYTYTPIGSDGYVNYDITNGFTGGSKYALSSNGLITSNKLITFTDSYPNANGYAWISLT